LGQGGRQTKGEVRLVNNKIRIFGSWRANVTGLGAREQDRFTFQQWWDAHVYVGDQVGIPEHVLHGQFRDDFEFLVKNSEHPEHVDFRFDQADADFRPPKWPLRGGASG